jgi:hypothetical protein
MNGEQSILIAVLIVMVFSIVTLGAVYFNQINVLQLVSDTNILKNNDLGFANYIQANANTLTYINENCKVTKDTNEITELTCIKSKGN